MFKTTFVKICHQKALTKLFTRSQNKLLSRFDPKTFLRNKLFLTHYPSKKLQLSKFYFLKLFSRFKLQVSYCYQAFQTFNSLSKISFYFHSILLIPQKSSQLKQKVDLNSRLIFPNHDFNFALERFSQTSHWIITNSIAFTSHEKSSIDPSTRN